ncbi:hypothetical protein FORC37_0837 [Vibrio vulnificus]|nr:hypothetical protein FORC37_0837 [Vibrio vulnificus]
MKFTDFLNSVTCIQIVYFFALKLPQEGFENLWDDHWIPIGLVGAMSIVLAPMQLLFAPLT